MGWRDNGRYWLFFLVHFTLMHTDVSAYQKEILGVRYARVPQRFAAAQLEPFPPTISMHTSRGPRCWQSGCRGEAGGYGDSSQQCAEDCLFLNVFRPSPAESGELLPVMVYIHGGGMRGGSGMGYNGSLVAATQRVLVVAINYRPYIYTYIYIYAITFMRDPWRQI